MALGKNLNFEGKEEKKSSIKKTDKMQENRVENRSNEDFYKQAIDTGWASIEFDTEGNILSANENFVKTLGYESEAEIVGKHHKIFCNQAYVMSSEYQSFWNNLAAGIVQDGEFSRIKKDGSSVWINASYTPIKNEQGEVVRVIKIAISINEMVLERIQSNAIKDTVDASFAFIAFDPQGNILEANHNFVKTLGYNDEKDIVGGHHSMFIDAEHKNSNEYKQFWDDLRNGKTQEGVFMRICRNGSIVWLQAAYTPVKDANENVVKVIKIATDITQETLDKMNMQGIKDTVDTSFAFIAFDPQGNILEANHNFVKTLGYNDEKDIIGGHHSLFVEIAYKNSTEYRRFWDDLRNGHTQAGDFKRICRDGSELWIQAAYTPLKNEQGEVIKVIKIATDITAQKLAEEEGKNVIIELNRVINIVNKEGDLSARLVLENLSNDNTQVVEGVNGLLAGIATPVLEIKRLISELAKGNLDTEFTLDTAGDIKQLGDAYNDAITNLNKLMGDLGEVANLVASSSEELLTKSDQMQGTTHEVASAIQQMAEGAHQQAQQTDEASKLVEEVLKSSIDMGSKADLINKAAEVGQKSSDEGLITVRKVVENMQEIESSAQVTSESIDVLTERSEEIARTLNVITDIAAQTNLLALNAAIEAARAGDAGRGFAVVAEEIRKLAEDSRKSAVDIQRVILAVQKDITQAGKAIDTMGSSVKSGTQASKDAETVFGSIGASTNETFELSQEIQGATEEQKMSINETVRNIEKIVVVSEETAAGSEQIATSSKELSQGMEEVNETSKQLATAANQLNDGVSKFKLKKQQ